MRGIYFESSDLARRVQAAGEEGMVQTLILQPAREARQLKQGGRNFLFEIGCNPLKSPDSQK
jgi:hypothetical protein